MLEVRCFPAVEEIPRLRSVLDSVAKMALEDPNEVYNYSFSCSDEEAGNLISDLMEFKEDVLRVITTKVEANVGF